MRTFFLLSICLFLTSCCGPVLRTARTLPEGETELTGGLVLNNFMVPAVTVATARGITDRLELEARYEQLSVFAIGPRYQVIDGGDSSVSLVTFASIGMDEIWQARPFLGAGFSLGYPLSPSTHTYWTLLGRGGEVTELETGRRVRAGSLYSGIGFRKRKDPDSLYFWGGEVGVGLPSGIDFSIGIGHDW